MELQAIRGQQVQREARALQELQQILVQRVPPASLALLGSRGLLALALLVQRVLQDLALLEPLVQRALLG